jgi:hypothetical protein
MVASAMGIAPTYTNIEKENNIEKGVPNFE